MSGRCQRCSASTTWDDSVGSAVCTSCGSLEDSSQSVLTSSLYDYHNSTSEPSLWDSSATTTLKRLRAGGNNWDLAGQGKESRDRKNLYAIAEFIKSLAVSFNASGLSPRAIALFNQARSANHFRWGQKSKFAAAACLAIALRESNRPDSLRDIASILDAPPASIIREFMTITSTLNLKLSLVDPSVYMSALQGHLASALQDSQPKPLLPSTLVESLRTLCLRSVTKTATSLSQILPRLSPEHNILRLSAAPTACGIFLLAIEAETRSILNSLGDLAEYLATRCHASKSVVMARYKSVQEEVACWAEQVPWLDKYEKKSGRAKVSKRLLVARSLKDVILFQDDIWEHRAKPSLDFDFSEDEDENAKASEQPSHPSPIKLNNPMTHATQFLLDPLGTSITSTQKTPGSAFIAHLPLASRVLVNPAERSVYQHPTRLQLLALERGGVTPEYIPDEDLFAEGEFERLLRSPDEVTALQEAFGWTTTDCDKYDEPGSPPKAQQPTRRKRKQLILDDEILRGTALSPPKKSRLNMEAFAKLMASHDDDGSPITQDNDLHTTTLGLVGFIDDLNEDNDDENACSTHDLGHGIGHDDDDADRVISETPYSPLHRHLQASRNHSMDEEGEVVLQYWRTPSPQHTTSDCRYEEERPP